MFICKDGGAQQASIETYCDTQSVPSPRVSFSLPDPAPALGREEHGPGESGCQQRAAGRTPPWTARCPRGPAEPGRERCAGTRWRLRGRWPVLQGGGRATGLDTESSGSGSVEAAASRGAGACGPLAPGREAPSDLHSVGRPQDRAPGSPSCPILRPDRGSDFTGRTERVSPAQRRGGARPHGALRTPAGALGDALLAKREAVRYRHGGFPEKPS